MLPFLLTLAVLALFVSAVWVFTGWFITRRPFKPWMWSRRRRAAVIDALLAEVRAGRMDGDAAIDAYRDAVGMDYLHFAFSAGAGKTSHISLFYNEDWRVECARHGWPYSPLTRG